MNIVCAGGGPAGLYFAISMKRRDPAHDITVIDRDPAGSTYGWGVVYWDDLLDILYRNDPDSAQAVRAGSVLWREQSIHVSGDRTAHFGGYGFSMGRAALLDVLSRRARDLGVDVQHGREVHDLSGFGDTDLIVASDGANSRVRQLDDRLFGTSVTLGENHISGSARTRSSPDSPSPSNTPPPVGSGSMPTRLSPGRSAPASSSANRGLGTDWASIPWTMRRTCAFSRTYSRALSTVTR
ncbi:hypothetical protein [Nocardia asiatica]|uniref:hypothetical protein n=1 Tax=Nocardia asiatica TaxID=209252 RepID=UPI003EE02A18